LQYAEVFIMDDFRGTV